MPSLRRASRYDRCVTGALVRPSWVDPAYDRQGFCSYRVTLPTGVMETVSIASAQRWTKIVQFVQEWCASD